MLKIVCRGLFLSGALMLLLALLSGGGALMASYDRIQHREGHISASAGSFLLLALLFSVLGAFSLMTARRIARYLSQRAE